MTEPVIVIPARDAAGHIAACLDALLADGVAPRDIVVVDDGSADATSALARARGATLIRNATPRGPGAARNAGVAATRADVVLFVDADVAVSPGTRAKVLKALAEGGAVDAVFGSYDAEPASRRLVSRYRNLLHHRTHQEGSRQATTFWAGLGAVRRSAFDDVGGFDPHRRYLEDIDLGLRMVAAGRRIELLPEMQGKHLKDWTLGSMFMTDWKGRAVPWARLLSEKRIGLGPLNTSLRHRTGAVLVLLAWLALAYSLADTRALLLLPAALAGLVLCNSGLFRLLFARGGPVLAGASVGFHALHYTAALLGFLEVRVFGSGARRSPEERPDVAADHRHL